MVQLEQPHYYFRFLDRQNLCSHGIEEDLTSFHETEEFLEAEQILILLYLFFFTVKINKRGKGNIPITVTIVVRLSQSSSLIKITMNKTQKSNKKTTVIVVALRGT